MPQSACDRATFVMAAAFVTRMFTQSLFAARVDASAGLLGQIDRVNYQSSCRILRERPIPIPGETAMADQKPEKSNLRRGHVGERINTYSYLFVKPSVRTILSPTAKAQAARKSGKETGA